MQLKELPKETSHTVHNNKDDDRKLQTGAQRIDGFTFFCIYNKYWWRDCKMYEVVFFLLVSSFESKSE